MPLIAPRKRLCAYAKVLASYARQSEDKALLNLALKIRAQAARRCGELLKEFKQDRTDNLKQATRSTGADTSGKTQRQAAHEAGLSKRQEVTAVHIANIPKPSFQGVIQG